MLCHELTHFPLFQGIALEKLKRLAPLIRRERFAAGEQIFTQGSLADKVYMLEHGEVGLCLCPEDGGCITITVIRADGIFGWSAALGRPRYTSGARSNTDSQVLVMRGADLRAVVQADPDLGRLLLGRMALDVAGRTKDDHARMVRLIQDEMAQANPP